MARNIEIEGRSYTVTEYLGYVHDVGAYAVEIETTDGFRKAIKCGGKWRFWTARDRTAPLRRALTEKNSE